ncbi:TGS domain-containing protein [Klebsiella pneumoniae subsp. pneumoniae]|nr:TGS domain-containing protein [Klebsiella pneumoniae subsp. pneumoniae]
MRSQVFDGPGVCLYAERRRGGPACGVDAAFDFAYHIHSDVGHRCIGAKIGGRNRCRSPTSCEMGDQIEIITQKQLKPEP